MRKQKPKSENIITDWNKSGFFKAYTPTKKASKEPMLAYTKVENQFSLEQCDPYPGVLGLLADDAVLFDADEEVHSTNLTKIIQGEKLQCMITNREGGRGIHALFKDNNELITKNATGTMLACGIKVDVKIGKKNGLDCLKFDGIERNIIYDSEEYQELPKYFKPLKNCNIDFSSLTEGDGRNTTLYSYILTLQSNDFTIEEVRETITIINKYVLKEPVSDDELEIILRDEAFQKQSFFKGRTFLHDKFANHIKTNNHIIKIDGRLNIYTEGIYDCTIEKIEKMMIQQISSLTDAKRKEVLKYLNVVCEERKQSDANLIAFRNGLLNIHDDTFIPFSPDYIITNKIDWDYNPNAYSEIADKTLNKLACQDQQIRMLLEEMIGYTFYRRNELGKAFILTGSGSNGKSTFIAVLNRILEDKNIAALDLKELNERFSTVTLYGKLANLGDDIGSNYIPDTSDFKKIVTGDKITAEQKGQPKFEFNPYCKLIFSANTIPKMKDTTNALMRRLVIIPFEARFSDEDPDYDHEIKYKLQSQESIEYFIRLGIEGLKRVLKNKKFSVSEKIKKELKEYEVNNNPVLSFIRECEDEDFQIENEPTSRVYEHYQGFCINNGYQVLSKTAFTRQLKQSGFGVGFGNDNGKTVRIYTLDNHT